jgi:hypothetical protein
MRKIKDILRLRPKGGMSRRQLVRAVGCRRTPVAECLRRPAEAAARLAGDCRLDYETFGERLYPARPWRTASSVFVIYNVFVARNMP